MRFNLKIFTRNTRMNFIFCSYRATMTSTLLKGQDFTRVGFVVDKVALGQVFS
jgi:hypothetical protein